MLRHLLLLAIALSIATGARAAHTWPEQVVTIDEMKMVTPFRIAIPRSRPKGDVRGPVVVKAHIDKTGAVQHVILVESCGSSGHDEAALHAMRSVRFAPKEIHGTPEDVTLLVPLHLPLTKPAGRQ